MCGCDSCSRCDLDADNPSDIVRPLCNSHSTLCFLAYRLVIAVYFLVFLVVHLSTEITGNAGLKIFIFLSDWTLILTTLYLVVAFLNAMADYTYFYRHGTYNPLNEPPTLFRLQWFLFNVCSISSFLICVSYWSTCGLGLNSGSVLEEINLHALPAVVFFIDLVVTAVPIRCVHVIYPIIYGAIYLIFAALYWTAGGTSVDGMPYIYNILNFAKPKIVLVVVVVEAVGALIFQWFSVGVSNLRNMVAKECNCSGRVESQEEIPLTAASYTVTATSAYITP